MDNTSDINKPISELTQNALNLKADLVSGKIPASQLPASQLPAYVNDILEATNFAAFPAVGESGKLYVDLQYNLIYRWSGSTYTEINKSLALGENDTTAYRGDRGKVAYNHSLLKDNPHSVTKTQVGLSNVDNTSDINKPISIDVQTALNYKVDVVAGKGLSTNDYTTTEKNKLAGIATGANNYTHPSTHSADILVDGTTNKVFTSTEKTKLSGIATGAEVNVQSDWNAISGDALILNKPTTISGYGITDAYTKTEVDNKLSAVYKYKGVVSTIGNLPSTGMVLGDVWNVTDTNINYAWDGSAWDPLGGTVGADVSLATPTLDGLLSASDFVKLSGIEANANNYTHPATHSADIIVDGTNNKVYTAAEKTKLSGIAAGAEVNVNADWSAVSGDAQILNKPTTISGYGITDAYTKTQVDTALSGKEPTITAGTTTQYWRGDKSWQTLNKAAVGLSLVENTALSTWAGSTNISTVGTITNGTWSGATIDISKGGTNLTALGTANQLLRVNSGASALEYFTPTWTNNTGTVTSVSMTVPTGLTVTGSPVTTAGTFALSLTSGYSIPTTAKQTNWDTAYGWGNHAGLYQPIDADLTSIAALSGTSGLLKKTAANTWSLDTSIYLTAITKDQVEGVLTGTVTSHNHTGVYEPLITKSTGYAKYNGSAWSFVDETYSLSTHTHSYLPLSGGNLTGALTISGSTVWHAGNFTPGNYQPIDADLTAIGALAGTSGLLRKTAADTWSLDTASYLTGITKGQVEAVLTGVITTHTHSYQPVDADLTAIAALAGTSGFLKKTAADTWSLDTSTYLTGNQTITLSGAVTGSGTTAITTTYTTVPTTKGGTGLTSIGTAGQYLAVNGGATALEWVTSRDKGVNTVTTLASLPISTRLVTATVTTATTISLASALAIGDELHIIVYNNSGGAITQTLPNTGSFISLSGTSISIPTGGRIEINILCYATTSYLIRAL